MTRSRLLGALGAWVVLSVALWVSGARPQVIALGGAVAAIAAVIATAYDLGTSTLRVGWPQPRMEGPAPREEDPRVAQVVRDARAAIRSDSPQLRDTLIDLVDERLLVHHNIDRSVTPDLAARMLTPNLQRLLTSPPHRIARVTELRAILTDIETL